MKDADEITADDIESCLERNIDSEPGTHEWSAEVEEIADTISTLLAEDYEDSRVIKAVVRSLAQGDQDHPIRTNNPVLVSRIRQSSPAYDPSNGEE